jgi:RNA polymerase sigma factor (sigma-70 family)
VTGRGAPTRAGPPRSPGRALHRRPSGSGKARRAGPRRGAEADQALTALYDRHYRALIRLAVLLTGDLAAAERITEDAFAGMHAAWRRLRDGDSALAYLRRTVVSGARCYLARRPRSPVCLPGQPPAGKSVLAAEEVLLVALGALPGRQREALVLHYYAGLPDAKVASAIGTSARSARTRIRRGMATLQAALDGHWAATGREPASEAAVSGPACPGAKPQRRLTPGGGPRPSAWSEGLMRAADDVAEGTLGRVTPGDAVAGPGQERVGDKHCPGEAP